MMRPRRYRLRLYVAAARALLRVLTRIDDWMLDRHHSRTTQYYRRIAQ
jgi:hypothetical protein